MIFRIYAQANLKTDGQIDYDLPKDARNNFYGHQSIDACYDSFENTHSAIYQACHPHNGDSCTLRTFRIFNEDSFAMDSLNVFCLIYLFQKEIKLETVPRKPNEEASLLNEVFIPKGRTHSL